MDTRKQAEIRNWVKDQRVAINRIDSLLEDNKHLEWEVESLKARIEIIMEAKGDGKNLDK